MKQALPRSANRLGYRLLGGHPALDFVNTVRGRTGRPGRAGRRDYHDVVVGERLNGPADLVRWAVAAGVVTSGTRLREARRGWPRVRRFREALYRVLKATIEGWTPPAADLAAVVGAVARARRREALVRGRDRLEWRLRPAAGVTRILDPVALAAGALLTSADLVLVRQCGGDRCGWLFLDTSRNRSRRWCSMGDCGTLAKVRRFRRRARSSARRGRQPSSVRTTAGSIRAARRAGK